MGNCLFGYDNRIVAGAVAAGAEVAGLEAANLQNDQGSPATAWQTPAGVLTAAAGAWFTVDAGDAAATWRAFLLARTNLTAAATVRWRVGSDPSFAAVVYDSGTIPAGVVPAFGQAVHVAPSEIAGRLCRCDIDDPGNPDACINVPLGYVGPVWQPSRNFGYETADAAEVGADLLTARGGQEFVGYRYWRRAKTLALPLVAAAELWPRLDALLRVAATGANILFVPNPDSADVARESLFGRISEPGQVPYSTRGTRWRRWQGRITERL